MFYETDIELTNIPNVLQLKKIQDGCHRILKTSTLMLLRIYASNPKAVHSVRGITPLSYNRHL